MVEALIGGRIARRRLAGELMTNDESRAGAYAPPPEDFDTFDAREVEQDRRGWLFLAAAAVVFLLFVAVVYNTFQLGVRERGASPVITADAEPYRVAPDEPGGYEAPNQDLTAYELREGAAAAAAEDTPAPATRPRAEEPVEPQRLPAVRIETADADALDAPQPSAEQTEQSVTPEPSAAEADQARAPEPEPVTQAPSQPADSAPAVRVEDAAPRAAEPAPTPAAAGGFVAQIGAFRSREDAESGWLAFAARYPDLAAGRTPDIQRADLGDRGVFHRLRIAAFSSRDDAAAFCSALDARGQACLVARR